MVALSTLDFWMGTMSLYLITALYLIMFRWIVGTDRGIEELHTGALIKVPVGLLKFMFNWSAPGILCIIFLAWLYDNIFNEVCQPLRDLLEGKLGAVLPMLWVAITAAFCCMVVHTSKKFRKNTCWKNKQKGSPSHDHCRYHYHEHFRGCRVGALHLLQHTAGTR